LDNKANGVDNMKKLGVAIIGCGNIHKVHADAVSESELGYLVCMADINKERVQASAQNYGCQWYLDYRQVLENDLVDVVHICTPHYLHAQMAMEAVRAGKHVLVEKPVAMNMGEVRQMVQEREKYNRHIGVCFQNRFNSASLKAKELIDSGALGPVIGVKGLVTWHRDRQYYAQGDWRGRFATEGGGVLINQSIHTLDLMQWLAGSVKAVKGNVSTRLLGDVIEVEDTADATLFFENGATGVFFATNCYTTDSPVEIEVHCEKARLRLINGKLYVEQQGESDCIVDKDITNVNYKSYWGKGHADLIEAFYHGVLNDDPGSVISVEEAAESLKIIDGIYKSSSTGNKIFI